MRHLCVFGHFPLPAFIRLTVQTRVKNHIVNNTIGQTREYRHKIEHFSSDPALRKMIPLAEPTAEFDVNHSTNGWYVFVHV